MGEMYLISPPKATDWRLDQDRFVERLVLRWPDADVAVFESAIEPVCAVKWFIHSLERWLEGSLDQAGQASYLRGDAHMVAEYAVWLRAIEPRPTLVLISDSSGAMLDLRDSTTPEQVTDFLIPPHVGLASSDADDP